jgi:hypothetical protein
MRGGWNPASETSPLFDEQENWTGALLFYFFYPFMAFEKKIGDAIEDINVNNHAGKRFINLIT